jgi:transcriptional regulator with XRE-family HTH domain
MNKIKKFRVKNGMTVKALSEKAKVATGYISVLENDEKNLMNPSRNVMLRIAKSLGQTVPEIFFSDENVAKKGCGLNE